MTAGLLLAALVTGAQLMDGDFDGRTVEAEGRVIGLTESGFAMKVDEIPLTVLFEESPLFLRGASITHPRVRVRGTLEQVHGTTARGGAEGVVGLRLRPHGAGDVLLKVDFLFLFNPFTLSVLLLILLAYLANLGRHHLKTRTLVAERRRMAEDLHDTIEQHLVGAGMLLQLGRNREAREILLQAKREMRDIVWGLRNDDLMRLTVAEMIRAAAKAETQKGLCRVETRLAGLPDHLPPREMRDLSLILREAVGNALKHGRARKVAIVSDALAHGGWRLRVANDGAPFDASLALGPQDGHFGVEGMKERARRLGGELTLAREGDRTVVTLVVKGRG